MWRGMVLLPPAAMREWVLKTNICLSILILLPGSQQHLFTWAPAATLGMLLSWGLTGALLILIHDQHFLGNPRQVVVFTLKVWLPFVMALQSSLAEAVLLLPLSTTTAMIYLGARQSRQSFQLQELPGPVPGPPRRTR
ncbi:hypothetical protein V8C35DRAFT_304300 [Trichoderma chlorosporum]